MTSDFHQMSWRGGGFQYGCFWGHYFKNLMMAPSNTSQNTQTPKLKINGGVMDVCAASVFEGACWKPRLGAYALCQGRTHSTFFFLVPGC